MRFTLIAKLSTKIGSLFYHFFHALFLCRLFDCDTVLDENFDFFGILDVGYFSFPNREYWSAKSDTLSLLY